MSKITLQEFEFSDKGSDYLNAPGIINMALLNPVMSISKDLDRRTCD